MKAHRQSNAGVGADETNVQRSTNRFHSRLALVVACCLLPFAFLEPAVAQPRVAPAPATTQTTQASQPAPAIIGSWQAKEGMVRFEPGRLMEYSKGRLAILRIVKIEDQKVVLMIMGQTAAMKYKIEGGELVLTDKDQTTRYKRLDKTPVELVGPKPLALPQAAKLAPDKVKTACESLEKLYKDDQSARSGKASVEEVLKVQAENTKGLKMLLAEVGWIDVARFGAKASNQALMLAQHSGDLPLMMAALVEVKKDVKDQAMDAQGYAMLYDRLQLMLGEKQRYGTQVGKTGASDYAILPLEDPAKVNDFRKEIGLFPLEDYVKDLKKKFNVTDIKVMEEK